MRRVTNPRESTLLMRESSCKRSGAYIGALSLGWHVHRSQSCMSGAVCHGGADARQRSAELALYSSAASAALLRARFALVG